MPVRASVCVFHNTLRSFYDCRSNRWPIYSNTITILAREMYTINLSPSTSLKHTEKSSRKTAKVSPSNASSRNLAAILCTVLLWFSGGYAWVCVWLLNTTEWMWRRSRLLQGVREFSESLTDCACRLLSYEGRIPEPAAARSWHRTGCTWNRPEAPAGLSASEWKQFTSCYRERHTLRELLSSPLQTSHDEEAKQNKDQLINLSSHPLVNICVKTQQAPRYNYAHADWTVSKKTNQ